MSPWTALLESLHSALIDELIQRHPEPKPELGMPIRQRELAFPASGLPDALLCSISFATGQSESLGFALLGVDTDCRQKLGIAPQQLWDSLIRRAGQEFFYRGIKPRLGNPVEIQRDASPLLPKGFPIPGRVIWVPFRLNPGVCYLGVAT
ncbi:hypothetical protein WDW37_05375 [Bdellovibrionota bacterium FG-1]